MLGPWQIFGKNAEQKVQTYLKHLGYDLLETNYRTRFAEIDIIARHKDTLVFIEVKARKSERKGHPREAVTPAKQKKICLAASYYLRQLNQGEVRVRFDVVTVLESHGKSIIEVIENAFQAG